ncbi:hypothetical protein [Nocardioides sp. P5_C9_2]
MKRLDASRARLLLLGVTFLLLPVATLALLAGHLDGGGVPPAATLSTDGPGRRPPQPLQPGESYVRTVVLPSGDLRVTHWIESDVPLRSVDLAMPAVSGAEAVEVRNVRVVADGRRVTRSRGVASMPEGHPLSGAGSVQVRYRLKGAVEPSTSTRGRGLALMTSLTVQQDPASVRVFRTVLAPEVLSLACAPTTGRPDPQPCGALDPDGGWTVELAGDRVDDRVLAQVTLR